MNPSQILPTDIPIIKNLFYLANLQMLYLYLEKIMKFGYARISIHDQNLQEQIDQLIAFGCEKIFFDAQTHFHKHQPELDRCLAQLESEDSLVVCALPFMGLSLKNFSHLMQSFIKKKNHFISLAEKIDTQKGQQPDFLSLMAYLSQSQQKISSEQVQSGLSKARENGKKGGRPPQIAAYKKETAYAMYINKSLPLTQIAKNLGISRMTIYRYIEERQRMLRNRD